MDVVIFTHHAKYEGSIDISRLPQAPRLQDMLNTPSMFNATSGGVPVNQIFLHNAKVRYKAGEVVSDEEKPAVVVFPESVELAYEQSSTFSTGQGLAIYERHKIPKEEVLVTILTAGQKRLTGILQTGLRLVTHPAADRHFFALTEVEIEEYEPEHLTTRVNFVLVGYRHVESILFQEKPKP